jgi:hypothetical protein
MGAFAVNIRLSRVSHKEEEEEENNVMFLILPSVIHRTDAYTQAVSLRTALRMYHLLS